MSTATTRKPTAGTGIYTVPDAARLLRLVSDGAGPSLDRLRRWIAGYPRGGARKHPAGELSMWRTDDKVGFSFYTLIEAFIIGQLRHSGVKMSTIRTAREDLAQRFETDHPFASRPLLTDGQKILIEIDEHGLLQLDKSGRLGFRKIVERFCTKIEFHPETQLAARLRPLGPESTVVVDPRHAFGRPVVEGSNIPTETLFSLVRAGEPPEVVAHLYELTEEQVAEAVEFERRLAA